MRITRLFDHEKEIREKFKDPTKEDLIVRALEDREVIDFYKRKAQELHEERCATTIIIKESIEEKFELWEEIKFLKDSKETYGRAQYAKGIADERMEWDSKVKNLEAEAISQSASLNATKLNHAKVVEELKEDYDAKLKLKDKVIERQKQSINLAKENEVTQLELTAAKNMRMQAEKKLSELTTKHDSVKKQLKDKNIKVSELQKELKQLKAIIEESKSITTVRKRYNDIKEIND